MRPIPILILLFWMFTPVTAMADNVWIIPIQGGIGPATSDYVSRELGIAREQDVSMVVLKMDTPGGLDTSMREIIRAVTTSSVPVATWVGPSGARAASAGTYILLASHIAAMAPGTNLGAATPVAIGMPGQQKDPPKTEDKPKKESDKASDGAEDGDKQAASDDEAIEATTAMEKKAMNDAAAYIQGLAKLHGRNEVWAAKAVREAASLDAESALEENVIDFIAADLDALVAKANGRSVVVNGLSTEIKLANVNWIERSQDWRFKFLSVITNPNVAYILMLIGIYGLLLEFYNPGVGLPGVLGGICLLLAMYSLQMLPVNYAGLALLLLGIALMVAEAFSPSFGILGLGGVVAFVLGSIMLMDSEVPGYRIALPLIIGLTAVSGMFTFVVLTLLLKTRRKPVVTGTQVLIGQTAKVVGGFPGQGRVLVDGEIWQARSDHRFSQGQTVVVKKVSGLWLDVDKEDNKE